MWRTVGIVALACVLAALLPHAATAQQGCPECEEYTLDIPPPKSGGGSKGGGGGGSTAPQDTAVPIAPVGPTTVPVEPGTTTEPEGAAVPEISADPDLARERRERRERREARRAGAAAAALKVTDDLAARESTPLAYERANAGGVLLAQLGGGGWAMLLAIVALTGSAALARRGRISR